jgi:hypothetical protein
MTSVEITYINELGFFFFFRIAVAVSISCDNVKLFSSEQREAQTYLFLFGARGITVS